MTEDTLYDRLGGQDGIWAVLDEFYDRLLDHDEVGPFFTEPDMEKCKNRRGAAFRMHTARQS